MCFNLIGAIGPNIAEKDIPCWKIMFLEGDERVARSKFTNFRYDIGTLYDQRDDFQSFMDIEHEEEGNEEGFHSYNSFFSADNNWDYGEDEDIIMECVIPKGSYYYENAGDHEYFSSAIIIKGIYERKNQEEPVEQGADTV